MFEALRKLYQRRRQPVPGLTQQFLDLPPHGDILVLGLPHEEVSPATDSIGDRLVKFAGRPTPFVGVLIDLERAQYRFSSGDLGGIAGVIAAWNRGWVAPCAIVVTGDSATELNRMLDITSLNKLQQIRVVESREAGLKHIITALERAGA